MTKPELDLGIEVIKYTFEKLTPSARLRVIEELKRETWADKLDAVTGRIRKSIKKTNVNAQDIDKLCAEVKQEYDEKHRRH